MNYCKGDEKRFLPYTDAQTLARLVDDGDLCSMWVRCVSEYRDRTALIYDGVSVNYGSLDLEVSAQRSALLEAGCQAGERIALLCENSIDFVRGFFAIVTMGGVAVVLPPKLPAEEIADCCRRMEVTGLLGQPHLLEKCKVIGKEMPGFQMISTACRSNATFPVYRPTPDEPAAIMLTGGTTGKQKGALLSHTALVRGMMNGCYLEQEVFGRRYLLLLPLTHIFGLVRNMLTSIYTGSTLYISRSPKDMIADMAAFHPTIIVLVPALAELALKLRKTLDRDIFGPSLETLVTGAAPMSSYAVEEYHRLGIRIIHGYGLTEAANMVSGNPDFLKKPGSIGLLYPEQELKIVDGELWLKGRNLLTSYVGGDEEAFTEDGWFRTGDLMRVDEDGYLYPYGRSKEMIKFSNGENIYPAEVESYFNELPFVMDCEVFADTTKGGVKSLALECVLRDTELTSLGDDPEGTAAERLWEVNNELPSFQQVRCITIRKTDFPRTPSGKIIRRKREEL